MRIAAFSATDIGLLRSGNEDSLFQGRTVFAVADGLGGHQAGEVASAAAVAALAADDGRDFPDPAEAAGALAVAVREANRSIMEQAAANRDRWGMGTTLTAAAVVDGRALQLAHVGDSRAYLLRGGELRQLTTDHTVVGELVRLGRLSRAQAAVHPERSVLTRAVGLDPDLQVDTPPPFELDPGDQVLLCSDGLTEVVDEERIAALLAAAADGDDACRALVAAANDAGGPDNVTVVLLRVEG
jgi:serine/threonine protein phosphatase PrpC